MGDTHHPLNHIYVLMDKESVSFGLKEIQLQSWKQAQVHPQTKTGTFSDAREMWNEVPPKIFMTPP